MSESAISPSQSSQDSDYAGVNSDDDINVTDIETNAASRRTISSEEQGSFDVQAEVDERISLREALRSWIMTEKSVPEDSVNRLLRSLRRVDPTLPATAAALFPMSEMKNDGSQEEEVGDAEKTAFCEIISRLDSHDSRLNQISKDVLNINQKMTVVLSQLHFIHEKLMWQNQNADQPQQDRNPLRRHLLVPKRCTTVEEVEEWIKQDPEAVARQCTYQTLRATVRAFIKLCMTRDLALQYSWSGLGEKRRAQLKICFKDSSVYSFMLLVLQHTPFAKATFTQISDSVKTVLAGVIDWEGGRKRGRTKSAKSGNERYDATQNGQPARTRIVCTSPNVG